MEPKVVVGTLTWNQREDVLRCLRSLVKLDYPNYEIVVVDNGSTDGTFEAIREAFLHVHMVRHSENLGCAEGVNGEIRYALHVGADYLFIIANDATVEPTALSELVRVAEKDPQIGLVHPKVYYEGMRRIWFARGGGFDWLRGRFVGFVQNVEDDGSFDEETDCDFFPGGFSLVRMEAIKKVGFLDPGYFIYFDDSDWALRIRRRGYRACYAPRARAWHKPASALGMETEAFYYYRTRNRLSFVKKYAPRGIFPLFFLYFLFEFCFETFPRLYLSKQKPQIRATLLGLVDFLRGKRGPRDLGKRREKFLKKSFQKVLEPLSSLGRGLRYRIKRLFGRTIRIRVRVEWNIGDEVIATPVYEALKRKFPSSLLEAQVRHPELLWGNPYVDLVNQKEEFKPDLLINLHREVRNRPRREYLREFARVSSWGETKVYLEKEELEGVKRRWSLEDGRIRVAISPEARWISRRWEREKWIRFVEHLIQGYGAQVFVLGKYDEPLPVGKNLMGQTSLREAAALLSQCHLFVGSDSGLVHLALAVQAPTIGLFGPLNPRLLTPTRDSFIPIWTEVECRGCWPEGRMKHADHCPKVLPDCLTSIPLSRVVEAVETLLERTGIRPFKVAETLP